MSDPMTGSSATLLLVDDMPILLEMLQEILMLRGYNLFTAKNGMDAYHILTQNEVKIDLVLTDLQMPDISGIMLAQKIYDLNPTIPVLLATGDDSFEEETLPPNIKGVLVKPYQPKAVIERIKSILSG
ncbi:MAG: response regulator [Armatimonadetes bacterium]|nr:response regulator [Armatimonadota bacterium]